MIYQIKHRHDDSVIYEGEAESFSALVQVAIKSGVGLSYAYLSYANLSNTDLSYACLSYANLRYADLSDANLYDTNLHGANLYHANLRGANLFNAYLFDANLSDANLFYANLFYANLSRADLTGANLSDADLFHTNLRDTNLQDVIGLHQIVPLEGSFTAYKKLANNVIAKLQIPEDAGRVGGWLGRKCRAEKAVVLEGEGVSQHDLKFVYQPGKTVIPDKWNDDPRLECSYGIHFFLTREEAEQY